MSLRPAQILVDSTLSVRTALMHAGGIGGSIGNQWSRPSHKTTPVHPLLSKHYYSGGNTPTVSAPRTGRKRVAFLVQPPICNTKLEICCCTASKTCLGGSGSVYGVAWQMPAILRACTNIFTVYERPRRRRGPACTLRAEPGVISQLDTSHLPAGPEHWAFVAF